ncbi:hypothetical protein [Lysinibacillus pakistanensis]|uniref:hypothetical protein n=1 Tax=Lysinibacillus pakistanensis TaxID=759811 RepID=UPI003D2CC826
MQGAAASGGALFTLTDIDLSPITATISANAPVIIGAGVTLTIIMLAVFIVPKMLKKTVKG